MTDSKSPPPFHMGRLGQHTLIYGAGMLMTKAVSFVMLPVYTRLLTPADYGVMELIGMTLDIVAIVAGAKLALGIFRYYHKAETEEGRREVVSTALLGLAASYGAVGAVTAVFAEPLAHLVFGTGEHTLLIRLAAAALALQSLQLVPLAYARIKERPLLFVGANLAKLLLQLGLNIYFLVYLQTGVMGVFLANVIASLAVGGVLAAHLVRQVGVSFSRAATRNLLRYGIPLMGTQVATFVVTFGDRYFLQRAGDATDVGLYSLAYQFGFLLAAVGYIPFEQVWEPVRFAVAKRADRDAVFARAFLYMNLVLLTFAVALSLFVPDVLRIMASPEFAGAASVVPIILVAYVLQGWAQMHDVGILVRERTEYVTLANWLAALVAVAAYALLIPRLLGLGAAVATVIGFAVRYAAIYYFSQRLFPIRYRWAPVLRLSAIALATGIAGAMLAEATLLASLAERSALLACYLLAVWVAGVLSPADRALVRRFVGSPRLALASMKAR